MTINELLTQAKKEQFQALQITEFKSKQYEISTLNEKLRKYNITDETNYEVKGKINNKFVKLNSNYLNEEILTLLKFKSETIESAYEDYILEKSNFTTQNNDENFNINPRKEIEKMLSLNNLRKDYSKIANLEGSYELGLESKRIVNSYGLDIKSQKNIVIFHIEATAKEKDKIFNFDDTIYTVSPTEIDLENITRQAMSKAQQGLVQKKIETGKYNIIFSSTFMSKIIAEMIPLFSKEQIRKKLSCLEGKVNTKICSPKVTLVEDAPNKLFPDYSEFDNEGTKTYKKSIIDQGILKTYLYNNKEAIMDNCQSTGNGYGSISTSNLYLNPGEKSLDKLIIQLNNGLYISDYLDSGAMILNPTNGEISVQIFGFIVSEGKMKEAIVPCILATNIFELLTNIQEIGKNLEFKTSGTASPAILVEKMSIASN